MKQLIKKYSILLISAFILARLLTATIMAIWPDILTKHNIDGSTTTFSSDYIERLIEYLMNIVFIVLISSEFKRQKIESIPILVVTFFSSFTGVLFFLIFAAQNKLTLITNER
ncbi:hypothetical protein JCM18694_32530 [Prolixibacter denitrificans]|uniref:Uncharacterized protein n=1 Tax=Prolixibacter denitrificans TaxID=1541063 RepID=A0ABQ0ZNH7_9BACT|nr:hypothetical protein JCM18694_32530 [Prolixibacter denitrificans]